MTTLRQWAFLAKFGVLCGALCGGPLVGCVQQDGGGDDDPDMRVLDVALAACEDGRDNDGDGDIDLDDPGCDSLADDDEGDEVRAACDNGVDDDGDGDIDGDDRGCADADDDDESDDPPTQCANGVDDDDDGAIDGDDRGCADPQDDDESDDPRLPACQNGEDDDDDGFVDFPADPGCGSPEDDDEANGGGPILPQCGNGLDDDGDGDVDLADSGCSSVADPREALAPDAPRPGCKNSVDDDLDGVTDFPLDPGCSAAGDEEEDDPAIAPGCGNGADDDGDGLTDYPRDPGCQGVGDRDETDPAVTPACADGADNDGDGSVDYPDDRGCESASDSSEGGACGRIYAAVEVRPGRVVRGDSRGGAFESEGSCGGRGAPEIVFVHRVERPIEALVIRTDLEENSLESAIYVRRGCLDEDSEVACNREPLRDDVAANQVVVPEPSPGEYYIFLDGASGRGGEFAMIVEEVPLAACLNGEDDDGDGLSDYPDDPGCVVPADRDEADPEVAPACFDGEDNDGDGLVDYPLDFGCQAAADEDEVDVCGQGLRILEYPVVADFVLGDTSDGSTQFTGSCQSDGPEKIYVYENPVNAALTFTVDFPETIVRTSLYVRRQCTSGASELGCGVDGENELEPKGTVELERAAPGTYFIFVDTQFGLGGPFKLAVDARRLDPGCSDGIDNDEDGFIDADDVGCSEPEDEDERDPPLAARPACFDRADNDDDGLIDYPFDPGCFGKGDADEADPDAPPECANGADDDEDGLVDFPADPGCAARGDDQEQGDRRNPQCTNRIDDDMDGATDYPIDPGCAAPGDLSEADDAEPPACSDDVDNDRDGLIDFPFDPGCRAAGHVSEADPDEPVACSNGEDDDGDGVVDFPFDPGCPSAGGEDETDPNFPPTCANGMDDDRDGLIDFPDDRGCRFRGDTNETDPFDPPSRCENSIDDDGDGAIDLRDPGCTNRDDDDELDPADPPECANGIDDDQDGLIDWPADFGCQARGDSPEAQTCREGVEVLDIAPGEVVVGETLADDGDDYRGRCGGREAPDHVFRYVLDAPADLRISADNPGTDYPAVIHVSRDCEEPRAMVACAGDFQRPDPTVVIQDAEPGEYFITIDGGGPERWVSDGGDIPMPVDPNGFQANDDIDNDDWNDGGNDAFDGYGRTMLTVGGVQQQAVVGLGVRNINVGGMGITVTSELVNNVWRLRYDPAIANDETPVSFNITGNMGSDGSTQGQQPRVEFAGRQLTYLFTTDGVPRDPPVVHLFVPSDPEQLGAVTYANQGDNVTITVREITLPATFYVALSYAANGNPGVVANALVGDLQIQAGGGGAEAPRFGNYELTVEAQ